MALVTAFSCAERFAGFLYRIFLSRSLGAELLGVYQVALSVIGVLVTLTASGIPITVSRLMMKEKVNGNKKGERDVVSSGILSSLIISLPITVVLFVFRKFFSFIFVDDRCYDVLLIMLPGVVVTSVYAVIRGYFWGNKNFFAYSAIELIEEIIMCVCGVVLVSAAADKWAATLGAAESVLVSYVASFTISTIVFTLKSGRLTNPINKLKPLIISSSPITATRTLTSVLNSIVAIILPSKLIALGVEKSVALKNFGELSGMALPLLFIPASLIGSIALVIVPKLSESFYKHDKKTLNEAIGRSFDYSVLISALIIPIFTVLGGEIGKIVYDSEPAGHYLSVSAFVMIPMSVTMILNSVLNSLNSEKKTFINFIAGSAMMIASVLLLTEFCGVYSLIIGYALNYVVTAALNFAAIGKITGEIKPFIKKTMIYTVGAALTAAFGYFLHGITAGRVNDFLNLVIVGGVQLVFGAVFIGIQGVFDFKSIFK